MGTPKKVIAIFGCGRGAGKSTLARFMVDYYISKHQDAFLGATVMSFTECLKFAASCLLDVETVNDRKDTPFVELGGKTPRDLLIFLGEGIKKEFTPDFFAKRMVYEINRSNYDLVVIDDLRFPIELETLGKAFGPNLYTVYLFNKDAKKGACEGLINPNECDWSAYNNGSIGTLYDEAVDILKNGAKLIDE